jgi:hypothetical protein
MLFSGPSVRAGRPCFADAPCAIGFLSKDDASNTIRCASIQSWEKEKHL